MNKFYKIKNKKSNIKNEKFNKGVAQRSSIAAGGGFYNVQPGTAAWFCVRLIVTQVVNVSFQVLH